MVWATHRRSMAVLLVAHAAAAFGCGGYGSEPVPIVEETLGSLGYATFRWRCIDDSDATCGTGLFPEAVAVGGRFELAATLASEVPDEITLDRLQSVTPDRLSVGDIGLQAILAGDVAAAALHREHVIDFVDLRILPVDRIEIEAEGGGGFSLVRGATVAVVGRVYSGGVPLAGALEYGWISHDPQILAVSDGVGASAQLSAHAVGEAEIEVTAGGHTRTLLLRVDEKSAPPLPPPDPTGDDGVTGTDGTNGGSGSGSDTAPTGSGSGSESGTGSETGSGSGTGDASGESSTGGTGA